MTVGVGQQGGEDVLAVVSGCEAMGEQRASTEGKEVDCSI